jgi:hypothetical protein
MPEYRATLGFNAFQLRQHNFTAENDEAVRAMQMSLDAWALGAMSEPIDEHSIDQHCDFPDA